MSAEFDPTLPEAIHQIKKLPPEEASSAFIGAAYDAIMDRRVNPVAEVEQLELICMQGAEPTPWQLPLEATERRWVAYEIMRTRLAAAQEFALDERELHPEAAIVKPACRAAKQQRKLGRNNPIGDDLRQIALNHLSTPRYAASLLALNATGGDFLSLEEANRASKAAQQDGSDIIGLQNIEATIVQAAAQLIRDSRPSELHVDAYMIGLEALERQDRAAKSYWQSCALLGAALRGFSNNPNRI